MQGTDYCCGNMSVRLLVTRRYLYRNVSLKFIRVLCITIVFVDQNGAAISNEVVTGHP